MDTQPGTELAGNTIAADALRQQVGDARNQLADLEAELTSVRSKIHHLKARLFTALRTVYEQLEKAEIYLETRKRFLESLTKGRSDAESAFEKEFADAWGRRQEAYEETARELSSARSLTADEEKEIKQLWKTLVKLFHPDRYADDPDKLARYTELMALINRAKTNGDLELLRRIAADPGAAMGLLDSAGSLLTDETSVRGMQSLLQRLLAEIESAREELHQAKASNDFLMCAKVGERPEAFDELVARQRRHLEIRIREIEVESRSLETAIQAAKPGAKRDRS